MNINNYKFNQKQWQNFEKKMKNLYSPTMLKKYLSCKYIIFNEINEKKLNLKKIAFNTNDKLRLERGNDH